MPFASLVAPSRHEASSSLSLVAMIFHASLIIRTILLANFGLSTLAEIVPRAGGGSNGVGGGGVGGGGRGGGSGTGTGSGGKSSSGGNRGSKPGHANGVTGGKLSGLRRFPNPQIEEQGHIIEDDASSVFSIGSFREDEQALFESKFVCASIYQND